MNCIYLPETQTNDLYLLTGDPNQCFVFKVMLAGRDIGMFVGVLTMGATWVGGGFINGSAQEAYKSGLIWTQVQGQTINLDSGIGVEYTSQVQEQTTNLHSGIGLYN